MKIALVFASSNEDFLEFVRRKKGSLLPRSSVPKGVSFDFMTARSTTPESLQEFLLTRVSSYSGVAIVLDRSLEELKNVLSPMFFVGSLEPGHDRTKWGNCVARFLSIWLSNLQFVFDLISDRGSAKIVMLPRSYFDHSELPTFHEKMKTCTELRKFKEDIEKSLSQLRLCYVPSRAYRSLERCLIDQSDRKFSFSLEQHAEAEDGEGHKISCKLSKRFLFGYKLDVKQHYNVCSSDPRGRIGGKFRNCHLEPIDVQARTHMNVFPNGYCT